MTALTYRERLRLAWELTWPLALIDMGVVFIIHGLFETGGETWDSIWALAAFFTVSPWVVRRALRRQKIGVVRAAGNGNELRYQESLKVMWLLAWRTLALSMAALLLVSLLLRVTGFTSQQFSTRNPLVNNLGLSLVDAISSLVFAPFLIPGMLKKLYKGFHLEPGGASQKKL